MKGVNVMSFNIRFFVFVLIFFIGLGFLVAFSRHLSLFNIFSTKIEQKKKKNYSMETEKITFSVKSNDSCDSSSCRQGLLSRMPNAKATILICHGYGCEKSDMAFLRTIFDKEAFNFLLFDFRAHGESKELGSCSLGRDEAQDVLAAADFLKSDAKLKNLPIFAFGWSMGAVATIEAQAQNSSAFNGLILDSPFDSTDTILLKGFNHCKWNILGKELQLPALDFLKEYAYNIKFQAFLKLLFKFFAGMDATKIDTNIVRFSPKDAMRNISVPCMIVGCKNDE